MPFQPGDYVLAALACACLGAVFFLAAGVTAFVTARRTARQR